MSKESDDWKKWFLMWKKEIKKNIGCGKTLYNFNSINKNNRGNIIDGNNNIINRRGKEQ